MSRSNGTDHGVFDHRDPERNLLLERIQCDASTQQTGAANLKRLGMLIAACFVTGVVLITLCIIIIL